MTSACLPGRCRRLLQGTRIEPRVPWCRNREYANVVKGAERRIEIGVGPHGRQFRGADHAEAAYLLLLLSPAMAGPDFNTRDSLE
jgi:hypothetical protein